MTKYCHITGAPAYHYIYNSVEVRPLLRLNLDSLKLVNLLILLNKDLTAIVWNFCGSLKPLCLDLVQGKKQIFKLGYIVLACTVKSAWQGLKSVLKGV